MASSPEATAAAALDAATQAVEKQSNGHASRAEAAAAVAAFLRALPREADASEDEWYCEWWATEACDRLAERVEEAARGE